MAPEYENVFAPKVKRKENVSKNDLYSLLECVSVAPTPVKDKASCDEANFEFTPTTGKVYIPKNATKLAKVKTVREIRNDYESEILSYLNEDIKKQENYFLKKIQNGANRINSTMDLALRVSNGEMPLTRTTWQIISNLNPKKHAHSLQYVLCNGSNIRVNGSKGGEKKYLCYFDLEKRKISNKHKISSISKKKHSLINNSLSVKFKAGPLSKKNNLDNSYQKFNIGPSRLVKLPEIGLEVAPCLGVPINPNIANLLHNLREVDGMLTEKYANFAVSTLGTIQNKNIEQSLKESTVFHIDYMNNQNKILMRGVETSTNTMDVENNPQNDEFLDNVITKIVNDMLDAVEVSMTQDTFYSKPDEADVEISDCNPVQTIAAPSKNKKRKYAELERLDVTVIRLSDSSDASNYKCSKPFCYSGCVCDSLECRFKIAKHCGKVDCIFECTCDFSHYKLYDTKRDVQPDSELISGLVNLDDKINCNLAKEEKKFHQTIVVTDEKSVLLKSQRRNLKTPKRYADYFSKDKHDQNVKHENMNKVLSIQLIKINCKNVEPLCMVHNLYRCFCKGIFVDSTKNTCIESKEFEVNKPQTRKSINKPLLREDKELNKEELENTDISNSARVRSYIGRKYSDNHYLGINKKIKALEINDDNLMKRMSKRLNKKDDTIFVDDSDTNDNEDAINSIKEIIPVTTSNVENVAAESSTSETDRPETENPNNITLKDIIRSQNESSTNIPNKQFPNKTKLIAWLEAQYKSYKQRLESGIKYIPLPPPKLGKIVLYPWSVIVDRYIQKKNFFFVTKEPPYRVFIAVKAGDNLFSHCINIDQISYTDLAKYPVTVKYLVLRKRDSNDNFFILCGLPHCWEFIGAVTKLNKKFGNNTNNFLSGNDLSPSSQIEEEDEEDITVKEQEKSKWFFMSVEDDFKELQFHTRGFFVKYENIIKAINVARVSGKTVRLSSQVSSNEEVQFGIYAMPHADRTYVFVGPYEINQELEIETLKKEKVAPNTAPEKSSQGIWVVIPKSDNINVLQKPWSYIVPLDESKDIITICNDNKSSEESEVEPSTSYETETKVVKLVKPIKINKKNEIYKFTTGGQLRTVSSSNRSSILKVQTETTQMDDSESTDSLCPIIKDIFSLSDGARSSKINFISNAIKKPIAEIAPNVKTDDAPSRTVGGMMILNPQEINKRLKENIIVVDGESSVSSNNETLSEGNIDIENFLVNFKECTAPTDVLVLSDDENDDKIDAPKEKYVWIECSNLSNVGCIKGRVNSDKKLSFEFPGFKFTEYYDVDEAYEKINQVLSRKVYVPKSFTVEWKIVEEESKLKKQHMMKTSDFGRDIVLTSAGFKHKRELSMLPTDMKSCQAELTQLKNVLMSKSSIGDNIVDEAQLLIKRLESIHSTLETEKEWLQQDLDMKKSELLKLIGITSSDSLLTEMINDKILQ